MYVFETAAPIEGSELTTDHKGKLMLSNIHDSCGYVHLHVIPPGAIFTTQTKGALIWEALLDGAKSQL